MTAKEYLSQAHYLDLRISSKLQQIDGLKALATHCTATISDMPSGSNKSNSRLEDCIVRIIDLENAINNDIDKLVKLKAEITDVIKSVENTEHQTLLEKRYLCMESWEQIAVDMGYSMHHLYKIHKQALDSCEIQKMIPKVIE